MRRVASFMILLLLCQLLLPLRALAEPITFDKTKSAIQGQLPVDKIGALLLSEGFASFAGTAVTITGKPELSAQTQSLLQGTLVKPEVTIAGSQSALTGTVYFNDGPALSTLEDKKFKEKISLTDATTVTGPISSITADQIVVGGKTIDLSKVATITSPRVFKIHVALDLIVPPVPGQPISGNASSVQFISTSPTLAGSTTANNNPPERGKGHHHVIVKVIAVVALGCIIATAIALPIALSGGSHHQPQLLSFAPTHASSGAPPVTSFHVLPPPHLPPPSRGNPGPPNPGPPRNPGPPGIPFPGPPINSGPPHNF